MGGGLMQLVAYGAQDIYLTGNPQITFFKVVYRRHTNFSMEAIEQTLEGSRGAGNIQTATISRNGDLIYKAYFEVTFNKDTLNNYYNAGAYMIDTVEIEIGGQMIDRHTGQWMETWAELSEPSTDGNLFQCMSAMGCGNTNGWTPMINLTEFYVPLQFWFCRNPGLALPLIALQYHEVKLKVKWNSSTEAVPTDATLYIDYIYLDTDERRRFAQVSHEYLIEQLQYQALRATTINELNFNHPVKELIWSCNASSFDNSVTTLKNTSFNLKLNGHDRFSKRKLGYFTRTQVWQHHTAGITLSGKANLEEYIDFPYAVYSFALKPEEHQPSGTCNFSRIDNAQLLSDVALSEEGVIFAVNYNVLRIMSGMGGLAYSN
jgi:hypothetical protein